MLQDNVGRLGTSSTRMSDLPDATADFGPTPLVTDVRYQGTFWVLGLLPHNSDVAPGT